MRLSVLYPLGSNGVKWGQSMQNRLHTMWLQPSCIQGSRAGGTGIEPATCGFGGQGTASLAICRRLSAHINSLEFRNCVPCDLGWFACSAVRTAVSLTPTLSSVRWPPRARAAGARLMEWHLCLRPIRGTQYFALTPNTLLPYLTPPVYQRD